MASKHVQNCTIEKRPKMLKEFLQEINTPYHSSSSSSSGFDPTAVATTLPRSRSRSRSRAAAEAALTSFQKLINAVKFSIKKKKVNKVKVKDILRWKSFHDVVADGPIIKPSYDSDILFEKDLKSSLTTRATIATTTSNSSSDIKLEPELNSRSRLSWGESDFYTTMDELPCWWGNFIEQGNKWDQTNDVVATVSDVEPNEDNQSMAMEEEKEQHSPVSVLDSPFRDETCDQEYETSFDKSFANMERTKQSLFQSILWLESLAGVSETCVVQEVEREEESIKEDKAIEAKKKAKMGGLGLEDTEVCIKEMDKQGQWSKFEEEKGEFGVELEVHFLSDLVNEILVELYG